MPRRSAIRGLTASVERRLFRDAAEEPADRRARQGGGRRRCPIRGCGRSIARATSAWAIDGIDSDNAVLGNLVATERTRAVRLAASYADTREKRAVSFSGSVSKGIDFAGARVTAPFADATFLKVAATASARANDRQAGLHPASPRPGNIATTACPPPNAMRWAAPTSAARSTPRS